MKNNTTTTRTIGTSLARTAGLLLLLGVFFLQSQATACPKNKKADVPVQASKSDVGPDYYLSSDNPFHAD